MTRKEFFSKNSISLIAAISAVAAAYFSAATYLRDGSWSSRYLVFTPGRNLRIELSESEVQFSGEIAIRNQSFRGVSLLWLNCYSTTDVVHRNENYVFKDRHVRLGCSTDARDGVEKFLEPGSVALFDITISKSAEGSVELQQAIKASLGGEDIWSAFKKVDHFGREGGVPNAPISSIVLEDPANAWDYGTLLNPASCFKFVVSTTYDRRVESQPLCIAYHTPL